MLALRVAIVVGKMEAAVVLGQPHVGEHHLPLEEWQDQGDRPRPPYLGFLPTVEDRSCQGQGCARRGYPLKRPLLSHRDGDKELMPLQLDN